MLSCLGMKEDARLLAESIRKVGTGLILAVTGAGVSAAVPPYPGMISLRAAAEKILPAVCRELGVEPQNPA